MMIVHADPGFPFYDSAVIFAKGIIIALNCSETS